MPENKIPYTAEPSPYKSLKEKMEKSTYGLQMARHIYSDHKRYNSNLFYNRVNDYQEMIAYAQGDQPVERYKKVFDLARNQDNSWLNIDWRIRGYLTKRINIIVNMLQDQQYRAKLEAIDQLSIDRKSEVEAKLKASFLLKEAREALAPLLQQDEQLQSMEFKSLDEIEMFMRKDYKDNFAREAEIAIEYFHETNHMEQIKKDCALWLTVTNLACVKTYLSPEGWPKEEFCSPDRLVVPRVENEDFRDLKKIGYIRDIAYSSFDIECGDEFSREQKHQIYDNYAKNDEYFDEYDNLPNEYPKSNDGKRIKVMDFSYITQVEDVYEFKIDDMGVKRMFKSKNTKKGKGQGYSTKVNKYGVPYRTNGKKDIYRDKYEIVISGTWIVGSEYVYNYKIEHNQDRDRKNLTKVHLPYHIYCPNMMRGRVKSLVEQVIPTLDDLQNYQLKISQHVASAVPKGAYINLDALENANFTSNGKTMDDRELLRLYFERGIVVGRDSDIAGLNGNSVPIRDMENGMARDVITMLELMRDKLRELDELLGLSEIMSASTPNPKTGARVSQMVQVQTNHALGHLQNAIQKIFEKSSMATLRNYQEMLRRGLGPQVMFALGKPSTEFMSDFTQVHLHDFGFRLEVLPNAQEWQELYADMREAWKTGQIDISDYYMLRDVDNLRQAQSLFEMKMEKRKREAAEAKQADIQANQQAQMQSAQMAAQAEVQTGVALEEAKQQTEIVKAEQERLTLRLKYDLEQRNATGQQAQKGLIESKQIQQRGNNDIIRDSVKEENKLTDKK